MDVLRHSTRIINGIDGYTHEFLVALYEQIINQQSDKIIDIKGDKE